MGILHAQDRLPCCPGATGIDVRCGEIIENGRPVPTLRDGLHHPKHARELPRLGRVAGDQSHMEHGVSEPCDATLPDALGGLPSHVVSASALSNRDPEFPPTDRRLPRVPTLGLGEPHGAHPLWRQAQDRAPLQHGPALPFGEPLWIQVVLREAPIKGHWITAIHGADAIDNHPSPHTRGIDNGEGRSRVMLHVPKLDPIRGGREEEAALHIPEPHDRLVRTAVWIDRGQLRSQRPLEKFEGCQRQRG